MAFKHRSLDTVRIQRLVAALTLLAFVPLARKADASVTVAVVGPVLWGLITFEGVRHAEAGHRISAADQDHHDPY